MISIVARRGVRKALSSVLPRPAGRACQLLACVFAALGLALGAPGCRNYFSQLDESRRLAADLHLQFTQAADASNRAVMADTHEASIAFAREAEGALQNVESDVAALRPALSSVKLSAEIEVLEEFAKRLAVYRELDRTILSLAVENTNLKAQRLAFGPAREAADELEDALAAVAALVAAKDRCSAEALIAQAVLAVREIQVLHAPHIAEPNDAAMTSLEREMTDRSAAAKKAVTSLTELVPPGERARLAGATSALDRFADVSRQIVALSRRNSNVRSLELSLRDKPALTAACEVSLRALQDKLMQENIKATR